MAMSKKSWIWTAIVVALLGTGAGAFVWWNKSDQDELYSRPTN